VVSWLERTGDGVGDVRLRMIGAAGAMGSPLTVAAASSGRATGIPRIARVDDALLTAWRDGRVRTARVPLSALSTAR
jgi:hypothetical protein